MTWLNATVLAYRDANVTAMTPLDPNSYIGYRIVQRNTERRGGSPLPAGGCGCLALAIGAALALFGAIAGH